jgi:hypothetical protein
LKSHFDWFTIEKQEYKKDFKIICEDLRNKWRFEKNVEKCKKAK